MFNGTVHAVLPTVPGPDQTRGMRIGRGEQQTSTSGMVGDVLGGGMPACGDATYRNCRQATHVRVGHGGPVAGCPLVAPLPTEQVDVVLDLVEDVAEAAASWPAVAWAQVARSAVRGRSEGPAVLARTGHCVAVTGRQGLLRHADQAIQRALPADTPTAGRIALTDALAAVVVSDVLPARHYLVLTTPLVVADV